MEDSTNIAVVSDHGHLNRVREIALNVIFREKGWLNVSCTGELCSWKVYAKNCGLSAEIYVADTSYEPEIF